MERMVELGGMSRASFYRYEEDGTGRPDRDMDLRDAIQRIALEWPSYGRPRITAALRRQGWVVNPKRVYRLLREDNLLCIRKRKFLVTTDSNHKRRVYPNLAGQMALTGINQLWFTRAQWGAGYHFGSKPARTKPRSDQSIRDARFCAGRNAPQAMLTNF